MAKILGTLVITMMSAASAKIVFNEYWVTTFWTFIGFFAGAAFMDTVSRIYQSNYVLAARIDQLYKKLEEEHDDDDDDDVPGFPRHLP